MDWRRAMMLCLAAGAVLAGGAAAGPLPDIGTVAPDLEAPPVVEGAPAPGGRVRQSLPEYEGTEVHHALYLPADWRPGRRYPVIVEYAGNGPYSNAFGDISTGRVDGSKLGYGISGGKGFLWLCLPYVNAREKRNQEQWWGDVDATLDYCRKAVRLVCEEYGGDPSAVILAGFSRGAIGCGYLGLHDDAAADIWLAFVPYSHYDGVITTWPYPGADRASAAARLARLKGRASFVCQEGGTAATEAYLRATGVEAPFVFRSTGFRNHNDAWALRDCPARRDLRAWLAEVLRTRPGTFAVRGRVVDAAGWGIPGARVESGDTHFAQTDAEGRYVLAGLTAGRRTLRAVRTGMRFPERQVDLAGDQDGLDFHAARPAGEREAR